MHGEVYGGVEHGVEAVCGAHTKGEWRDGGDGGPGELLVMELSDRNGLCGAGVCTIRKVGDFGLCMAEI